MEVIPQWPPILAILLVIPFCVTLVALHFILFRPLLAYLDERERVVGDARSEARELGARIEERLQALQERLSAAREDVSEQRATARARALAEEQRIVDAARRDAEARMVQALGTIAEERAEASRLLHATAASLSHDIASAVLGREVAHQEAP